jgi:hypothetical protein
MTIGGIVDRGSIVLHGTIPSLGDSRNEGVAEACGTRLDYRHEEGFHQAGQNFERDFLNEGMSKAMHSS